jgi:hypothetical protein
MVDRLISHLNFGIEKHTLTRFYTAGFRFFSASFAFSCAVPDGLFSPSPLRDASMMRDDPLLYRLFMSPERMPCTVKLPASVSHHEHYILANSCFYNK